MTFNEFAVMVLLLAIAAAGWFIIFWTNKQEKREKSGKNL